MSKPNPLMRTGRVARLSAVSLLVTATGVGGTLFGAGLAGADDPVIASSPLAVVSASPGQPVEMSPKAMADQLYTAVLLDMPANFTAASQAKQRFEQQAPIMLGTAGDGSTFYSGSTIADAVGPRISQVGLPPDKVGPITQTFEGLVKLGTSVTVNLLKALPIPIPAPAPSPAPQPSDPPSNNQPPPKQSDPPSQSAGQDQPAAPPETDPVPAVDEQDAELPALLPLSIQDPVQVAPAPVQAWPMPAFEALPGQARPAHPNGTPGARPQQQSEEDLRAAGKAMSVPTISTDRVALPVLVAAILLAVVTAGLVRTWVLRRG